MNTDMMIDYADDRRIEQMVTLGSLYPDIDAAYSDAIVEHLNADLRAAATRVRAIRTLVDFDARTAEIAASLNPERSTP